MSLPKYAMDVAGMKKDQEAADAARAARTIEPGGVIKPTIDPVVATAAPTTSATAEAAPTRTTNIPDSVLITIKTDLLQAANDAVADAKTALAVATTYEDRIAIEKAAEAKLTAAIAEAEATLAEAEAALATAEARERMMDDAMRQADANRTRESSESLTPIEETHGLGPHASDAEILRLLASRSSLPPILQPPMEPKRPQPLTLPSRNSTIESQVPPAPTPSNAPEISPRVSAPPIPGGAKPNEADKETLMDMRPPVARDSRPSPTPQPRTDPPIMALADFANLPLDRSVYARLSPEDAAEVRHQIIPAKKGLTPEQKKIVTIWAVFNGVGFVAAIAYVLFTR